jgi:hypothetical protein
LTAVIMNDGTSYAVDTFGQFLGWYGELWCQWTTTNGESYASPRHHIDRITYDNDTQGDMGFG